MKHFRLQFNNSGLEFDHDYGIEHRFGWSLFVGGHYLAQFVSFFRCLFALIRVLTCDR